MEPEITLEQVEGWAGGQNGDNKYRQFHQELWLSHRLRMKGTEAEKFPWGKRGSLDEQLRVIKETDGLKPVKKYIYKNWGERLPLICSGTSLPGWAILCSYHSLNLVEKYQIVVTKEQEQRKQEHQGDNEVERLERKKLKLSMEPRLHMEGIVVLRRLIILAENEWAKGLGTLVKTKGTVRGNAVALRKLKW